MKVEVSIRALKALVTYSTKQRALSCSASTWINGFSAVMHQYPAYQIKSRLGHHLFVKNPERKFGKVN
ncbi:hypothetical protein ACE6H2_022375 [Prunus campanulata]